MLNVNIITVGKLKEDYLKSACKEYIKRLTAFCRINVVELSEYRLSDTPSEKEILNALKTEAQEILRYIKLPLSYNIAMCIEGRQLSSKKLAEKINDISVNGKSTVNFVIGSSFGIDEEIKNISDLRLSMSEMTFPHQLARVMLLEQIYRSFQINSNGKYHK